MFGIGMPELILILAIALIVIGPKKLPDLAKSLGRAMREFKKATSELKGSLELDGEMKEVKDTFQDIKSDIKNSVLEERTENGSQTDMDRKVVDLEKGYEAWDKNRSSDSVAPVAPTDEGATSSSSAEAANSPHPPGSDAPPRGRFVGEGSLTDGCGR